MQPTTICEKVEVLSGSLKPYTGTDNEMLDDDEKAFLQAILDDDNRIKKENQLSNIKTNSKP